MYVTELTYKIEKDGVEINKLTISPGETVVSLTIKSYNDINFDGVFGKEGAIYPVISLKSTSKITGGTGLYNDPYIIE